MYAVVAVLLWSLGGVAAEGARVVINELHTNPDVKTELVEFVELYNPGPDAVDLSGWSLSEGVFYTFGAGTVLPADGYIVVAQDLDHLFAKWSTLRLNLPGHTAVGPFGGKLSNDGERVTLCDAGGNVVDSVTYKLGFPWPTVGDPVPAGQRGSGPSLQLVHPDLDNDLGGSWRSAYPTPGFPNTNVFAERVPPYIRQVKHTPQQPRSGQPVAISAKITDADGLATVQLMYQFVDPGDYISIGDVRYRNEWTFVDMRDDGLEGDATAGDDIYTVVLPAELQMHRRLVRYKIVAITPTGSLRTAPYDDDPQPNFAYFVYNGVPAWRGAIRPGSSGTTGQVVAYSPQVLTSLPVYHVIADRQDVADALYMPGAKKGQYGGSDYPWSATLVYDGRVYDHIRFRARGGVWRYAMGKNMWKFDFNRGHEFQAHDDYGRPYDTKWRKLNFSACIQQGDYQHRGEQGMFEAASFRLFNMMGVEAPKTSWLHFRVIDDADEFGATQYDGDFWGLYMTIEQVGGRFLDEHGLPDGNLYKMESGTGELNNQGLTAVTDKSDLNAFMAGYRSRPPEPWWRQNVDVARYFSYRCVVEGVHHGDIAYGKNWFYYLNPETNLWSMVPWDVDLTWANNMFGSGEDEFKQYGRIFSNPNLNIEFQNRLREFFDLLYNADQAWQLLDEMADVIDPPTGGPTFVDADRAMWDYNPIMVSGNVNPSKSGQGRFYQRASTKDFRGMVQIMKDYIVSNNRGFNTYVPDSAIPQTPVVTATGPADFPANALTFRTSAFADPQGADTFAAMKWRIGEVTPGSQVIQPDDSSTFVLLPESSRWKYFKGTAEPSATLGAWRDPDFDDSTWLAGTTPIGFGEAFLQTNLHDMRGNYTTIYLRKTFDVANVAAFDRLVLDLFYDDGLNVWINGRLVFQDNVVSDELPHNAVAISAIEMMDFVSYDVGLPSDFLVEGTNVIAVQVFNASLSGSSDCFIDLKLSAERIAAPDDETPLPVPVVRREAGRYEIDAVWETPELTVFDADIRIPASVVKPGRTYRVRCRMQDDTGRWSHWSSPVQFVAGEPVAAGILADLRITELMYNPAAGPDDSIDNNEFEFVELKNIGDETLDLSGVSLTEGVRFDFAGSDVTTLGPGRFVLVVRNKQAFLSRYGPGLASLIAGQYEGKLANGGETVRLEDFWNGVIAEFTYSNGAGWPIEAAGAGHSLVPLASAILDQPFGSPDYGGNWRASAYIGGSPGADDPEPVAIVAINEFLAGRGAGDWIELYNPTDAPMSLANVYLSDDPRDLKQWPIPAPAIGSRQFLSFDEAGDGLNFGLSQFGEQIFLSYLPGSTLDRVVDAVQFQAQEEGVSKGRYPDGGPWWFRMAPSRDVANAMPIADIVIDEIMYHPADGHEEYIELFNPTDVAIALSNDAGPWRLSGAVEYRFDPGLTLEPGARLVIIGFDPLAEVERFGTFLFVHTGQPLLPGIEIVGPWQGNLANSGERLVLERPLATDDPSDPAWAIVDEVIYSDTAAWPTTADGSGDALQRTSSAPDRSGNDPANWHAAPPSPGLDP
ncbi:lamin tail domain-containing protein [Anaerobaca lacustris]|uniref:Lamin tail domain-containing protein n=1 Tax=Anaerobaca lacustris TaxID=3044600 RepID=A0AAW6TW22_9BACT|nr:lamin tail domain-containing protein [Sedimentisphaerales bacterium M17dextr]